MNGKKTMLKIILCIFFLLTLPISTVALDATQVLRFSRDYYPCDGAEIPEYSEKIENGSPIITGVKAEDAFSDNRYCIDKVEIDMNLIPKNKEKDTYDSFKPKYYLNGNKYAIPKSLNLYTENEEGYLVSATYQNANKLNKLKLFIVVEKDKHEEVEYGATAIVDSVLYEVDPFFGSTKAEKQSAGNAKINIGNKSIWDDGSNTTINDDDWSVEVNTKQWFYTSSAFQYSDATIDSIVQFDKTTFNATTLIYKINYADNGNAIYSAYLGDGSGSYQGVRQNGIGLVVDFDGGAKSFYCFDGTGNFPALATYNLNAMPSATGTDYYYRFIWNNSFISFDISTDGFTWTNYVKDSTNCSIANDVKISQRGQGAIINIDNMEYYKHNNESINTVLSLSFEQGTAVDESLYSNPPEINNVDFIYDTNISSNVADFDNIFDFINLSNSSSFDNVKSFSAMVKLHTVGVQEQGRILNKRVQSGSYEGWGIIQLSAGKFYCLDDKGSSTTLIATTDAVNPEQWYHVACEYNSTHHNIYVNGVLNASNVDGNLTYTNNSANVQIGYWYNAANEGLNGSVDCIKVSKSIINPQTEYQSCLNQHGLQTVPQGTTLTAITTNGTTVEGWYSNGTKIAIGDSYTVSVRNYQKTVCANMTNSPDSIWTNCLYVTPLTTYSIINVTSLKGIEGGNITSTVNASYGTVNASGTVPFWFYVDTGTNTLTLTPTGWFPISASVTTTNLVTTNVSSTSMYNADLKFLGDISGTEYYPQCSVNSTLFNNDVHLYETPKGTSEYTCEEGFDYQETLFNVTWTETSTLNTTLYLDEYFIALNFTDNTTGRILWTLPNDNGLCCQIPMSNDFNTTTFEWIKTSSQFTDGDTITIVFNNQTNDTVKQFYEFVNERDTIRRDHVGVLNTLDYIVWGNVYNYGNDKIYGATITVTHYPNSVYSEGYVVQKVITKAASGDANPGVPIALDKSLDYQFTISADGYETLTVTKQGIDLENNEVLNFKLKPTSGTIGYNWLVSGQVEHSNESRLIYTISTGNKNVVYWDTNTYPYISSKTLEMGGGTIGVYRGVQYNAGQNFTLRFYTYNSTTASYVSQKEVNVTYVAKSYNKPLDNVLTNSNIIATLLLIALIAIASIMGALIQIDGMDTGYYIFGVGSFILGILYIQLLPISVIFGLTLLAKNIINTTKD